MERSVDSGDVAREGLRRNNLAVTLLKLRRFDEAREEIRRAIECKEQFGHATQPWTSWDILADIEAQAGNMSAATEARRNAIALFLAYRRDGGENYNASGRIALAVTQALVSGNAEGAHNLLAQIAATPDLPVLFHSFIKALQEIVGGSLDRALADDPDLHYTMAAEILNLIETLDGHVGATAG